MDRRNFIRSAGVAAAAVPALAAPAIAQTMPEIKWRMTSSFPKALDTIYGAAETFARYVAEATDNLSRRFDRDLLAAAGEDSAAGSAARATLQQQIQDAFVRNDDQWLGLI